MRLRFREREGKQFTQRSSFDEAKLTLEILSIIPRAIAIATGTSAYEIPREGEWEVSL